MRLGDLDALKEAYFNAINETPIGEVSIIDIIDNAPTVNIDWEKSDAYLDCVKRIKSLEKENDELRQFLKANFEIPQGKWIKDIQGKTVCSNCGFECLYSEDGFLYSLSRYCPNCGAFMRGEKNDKTIYRSKR